MSQIASYYRNKTILVTGAASGIGRRFTERVARYNPERLILWDRNTTALTQLRQELSATRNVQISGVDVSDPEIIQIEADNLIHQDRVPDLVLNCAGIVTGKYFHQHNFHEIGQIMQVNVAGSMWVVNAFLDAMIARGSGHIVNLASASAYIGNPKMSVYAASKWAVLGWTESLQLEMKRLQTGIDVTAIIPSYIDTGMFKGVKAPALVPILSTEAMTGHILRGVASRKMAVKVPFMVRFVPLLKAILPQSLFDWVAGSLLGVYTSMDTFKGREQETS
ncbi:MAG TPA: SDR family NAD(P)-dependent oxidoreductase [Balneolaceae bacterium]|nr:SDR family NAD(P)-dependent oxidoreductase [Balneolaceae bacterium]